MFGSFGKSGVELDVSHLVSDTNTPRSSSESSSLDVVFPSDIQWFGTQQIERTTERDVLEPGITERAVSTPERQATGWAWYNAVILKGLC